MSSRLDEIFETTVGEGERILPYSPGESFPKVEGIEAESANLFCFISLYCLDCIELLGHLKVLSESFQGKFVLFTDGTTEENRKLSEHFEFGFRVISYSKEDLALRYRVSLTPFVYVTDSNGTIIHNKDIDEKEDFDSLYKDLGFL